MWRYAADIIIRIAPLITPEYPDAASAT